VVLSLKDDTVADTDKADQLDTRLDHHFSSSQRFFARYSCFRDDSRSMIPLPGGSAEAFNVSYTPPLGPPNGSFGSAVFGSITTAGDSRVFELLLKVKF
jgi:hypothetical protein